VSDPSCLPQRFITPLLLWALFQLDFTRAVSGFVGSRQQSPDVPVADPEGLVNPFAECGLAGNGNPLTGVAIAGARFSKVRDKVPKAFAHGSQRGFYMKDEFFIGHALCMFCFFRFAQGKSG